MCIIRSLLVYPLPLNIHVIYNGVTLCVRIDVQFRQRDIFVYELKAVASLQLPLPPKNKCDSIES